jgi:hypothetical protein
LYSGHDQENDPSVDDQFRLIPVWIQSVCWYSTTVVMWVLVGNAFGPLAGVLFMYFMLAWGDLATALWIRWRDPNPARGRALFWFLLADVMFKVTLLSFALVIGFLLLIGLICLIAYLTGLEPFLNRIAPPEKVIVHFFAYRAVVAIIGLLPMTLLVVIACVTAKRGRIKVWMDGSLDQARREQIWPPCCDPRYNRANRIILFATAVVFLSIIFGNVAVCMWIPEPYGLPTAILILGNVVFGWYVIARGVVATSPSECWPPHMDDDVFTEQNPF